MTLQEVEEKFHHHDWWIRYQLSLSCESNEWIPTPEQFIIGTRDKSPLIREQYFALKNVQIQPEQVEEGLTDKEFVIRRAVARRTDYIPTPHQIERALNDTDPVFIAIFLSRSDFTLTSQQVEWGYNKFNTSAPIIYKSFILRKEFIPTDEQILRGLMHLRKDIQSIFESKQNEWRAKRESLELRNQFEVVKIKNPRTVL